MLQSNKITALYCRLSQEDIPSENRYETSQPN